MTCFRILAVVLLFLAGCSKKDEPIPLPGQNEGSEPRVVGVAETGVVAPTASVVQPSPGATVVTPKGDAGAVDGGTGLPPMPPSLLPTDLPSSLPPLPTLLPSAFPLPLPART